MRPLNVHLSTAACCAGRDPVSLRCAGCGANGSPARTLSIAGNAEVHAVPDAALVSTGVVTEGETAAAALKANSAALAKVIDAIRSSGSRGGTCRPAVCRCRPAPICRRSQAPPTGHASSATPPRTRSRCGRAIWPSSAICSTRSRLQGPTASTASNSSSPTRRRCSTKRGERRSPTPRTRPTSTPRPPIHARQGHELGQRERAVAAPAGARHDRSRDAPRCRSRPAR